MAISKKVLDHPLAKTFGITSPDDDPIKAAERALRIAMDMGVYSPATIRKAQKMIDDAKARRAK